MGVGSAAGAHAGSLHRCRHHKHSNLLLLGCASVLASVGLGQDLLHLGRLQVNGGGELFIMWISSKSMAPS